MKLFVLILVLIVSVETLTKRERENQRKARMECEKKCDVSSFFYEICKLKCKSQKCVERNWKEVRRV